MYNPAGFVASCCDHDFDWSSIEPPDLTHHHLSLEKDEFFSLALVSIPIVLSIQCLHPTWTYTFTTPLLLPPHLVWFFLSLLLPTVCAPTLNQ